MPVETPAAPSELQSENRNPIEEIQALERDYLLQNYARYNVVLDHGEGPYIWDVTGRRYLDFITGIGVNALGYNHPRLTAVIREQAGLLIHTSNLYYHRYQGPLAQKIAEVTGLNRCFFSNSGAESVEGAIKAMHSHGRGISPEKFEILSLDNSFHGRTIGALSLTGQPKYRQDFEPLMPGVRFIERNNLDALEGAFSDRTAGIIMEWIQGEGGILSISSEFAERSRQLADRFDALLVFDETQCGVGRTGRYFSYQLTAQPVLPDIMVAAKPIGCGLPLGVIAMNERAAASIRPGMHGSTFGGSALSCRVALEFFDILKPLLPSIQRNGELFRSRLGELGARYPFIKEVRGQGLMVGVELNMPGAAIVKNAITKGLLLNCTHETVLRFLPPYIIGPHEIDEAVEILDRCFAEV